MTVIRRLVFVVLVPVSLAGQQPVIEALRPENGRIDSVYQTLSVRELRDGRLLVSGRDGTILVVDFATHQAEELPDVRASTTVIALPGDSTVVVIPGTAGWIFLQGTRLLGMLPASNPVVDSVQQLIGVDDSGSAIGVVQGVGAADSDRIVRVGRRSGTVDVVKRTPTADEPGTRYDVIDHHGVLMRTVQVGDNPNDLIVGFGQHVAYVWVADSKHGALGHIERHPWP